MFSRIPLLYDDIAEVHERACDDGAVIEVSRTTTSEDGYTLILTVEQARAIIIALEPFAVPERRANCGRRASDCARGGSHA